MTTANVAHCSVNDKGDSVEIIIGNGQEVVDFIRDRRLSYGSVNLVYMLWDWQTQPEKFSVKLTYKIKTF